MGTVKANTRTSRWLLLQSRQRGDAYNLSHNFLSFIVDIFINPLRRIFLPYLSYNVDKSIYSAATVVIFTRSKRTLEKICLRLWRRFSNDLCDAQSMARHFEYVREGLEINRKFAPGVYLGVACVKRPKPNWNKVTEWREVERGKLITNPIWNIMAEQYEWTGNIEYAFVMKCLPQSWRLDNQLQSKKLANERSMRFLAQEIAYMHKNLETSKQAMGTPQGIQSKLNLNLSLLQSILPHVHCDIKQKENYKHLINIMKKAYIYFIPSFNERYKNSHIKRCHGDLKAANLWIRPAFTWPWHWSIGTKRFKKQLLALDCIDFNAKFCNIDTLSDIAMLAIDIEMYLMNYNCIESAVHLVGCFLTTYLERVGEDSQQVQPLLEYYLTEKAIVCACISVLYEKNAGRAKKYLDVAMAHAKKLQASFASCKQEGTV
ncbi:MAG TPA: hypothetical protein VFA10_24410 [Ktedonobacteraceae bacterium]|nr:hypothetical protein [Ktedonobacteraceae bacterium]